MNKSRKKRILFIILFILVIYAAWLGIQIGITKTYKNSINLQFTNEAVGVYHIHSTFSDGRKSADKITRIAASQELNFIIFTDHGHPNYESLEFQGKKDGIMVLAGSELSVNRGHLAALGFDLSSQPFSQNAEEAVYQIRSQNGFSIICHPYSKVKWSWGRDVGYHGIEIINGNTMLKAGLFRILPYLPLLPLKPEAVVLRLMENPNKNLWKWDELCRDNPVFGYYAADAHLLYGPAFQTLRIHLCLDHPLSEDFETARKQIYSSLERGRFYNAIDAAADAGGFHFQAVSQKKMIPMGTTVVFSRDVEFNIRTPYPFAVETQLLCNGTEVLISRDKEIIYRARDPGTYRVQVFLRERTPLGKNVPWILSNPIFLR